MSLPPSVFVLDSRVRRPTVVELEVVVQEDNWHVVLRHQNLFAIEPWLKLC